MNKKIILLLILPLLNACWITTTNGSHTGQVTAIEKTGAIWPTWDIHFKTDISSSQEDHYCITDDILIQPLKKASENRQRVTLYYHDEAIIAPWRCGSASGIVDTVDYLN